ncbi:hypothetical protein ACF1BE_17495 [Streptomyces sp. NPDC014991]|uniref:hypothetical protein n=1 Tax=Streptomyces sp. NPDC014991 TaxID=3364935 RepID=UPI0036FB8FD8
MNGRRVRLAVLAPLAVSSLALGSMTFSASTAVAATPSCSVARATAANTVQVSGKDFKANRTVVVASSDGADGSAKADASGNFSLTITGAEGAVSAQQVGGTEAQCGSVAEQEKKNAQDQFSQGYRQGFADMRKDCKKNMPQQDVAPDPNWEAGFDKGAAAAAKQFCND